MNEEVEEEEGEGDGSTFERERERDFEGDGQRLQFLTRAEFWGSLRDLRKFLHVSVVFDKKPIGYSRVFQRFVGVLKKVKYWLKTSVL